MSVFTWYQHLYSSYQFISLLLIFLSLPIVNFPFFSYCLFSFLLSRCFVCSNVENMFGSSNMYVFEWLKTIMLYFFLKVRKHFYDLKCYFTISLMGHNVYLISSSIQIFIVEVWLVFPKFEKKMYISWSLYIFQLRAMFWRVYSAVRVFSSLYPLYFCYGNAVPFCRCF